jgi:spermidine synthase
VIVLGDARLALEREPAHDFDLLVVDAFSSDSIPAHLLTKEAFRTYWKHMRSDGIIAVNTSNRYLDLTPIVAASAEDANKVALWIRDGGDKKNASVESDWVLVSATRLEDPLFRTPHSARIHPGRSIRTWTDDYSSLLGILK